MKTLGCLTLVATLLWSGLCWAAFRFAGAGEMAIVRLSHWLGIPASSTQWIAELFAMAGSVAQFLVIFVWLLGMAAIAVLAWLGVSAVDTSFTITAPRRPGRQPTNGDTGHPGSGPTIDGEVQSRHID